MPAKDQTTDPMGGASWAERKPVVISGVALAMAASGMFMPPSRLRDLPPPKKRANPKRDAQAAQRKARAINRRAGK